MARSRSVGARWKLVRRRLWPKPGSACTIRLSILTESSLWDPSAGAYKDNPSSTLYPQDGNSLAVWYGLTTSAQSTAIMAKLRGDWNSLGAQTPEFSDNISPFAGSMELYAHSAADDASTR